MAVSVTWAHDAGLTAARRMKRGHPGETAGEERHLSGVTFLLSCWSVVALEAWWTGSVASREREGLSVLEVSCFFPLAPRRQKKQVRLPRSTRILTKITGHEIISLRPARDGGHMEIHSPPSGNALSREVSPVCAELRRTTARQDAV